MAGKEKNERRITFLNGFGGLCERFNREPSEFLINIYYKTLKEFTTKQITEALSIAIRSAKFFPSPEELLENITGPKLQIEEVATNEAMKVLEKELDCGIVVDNSKSAHCGCTQNENGQG